jgi:hypothetical protein
VVCPVAQPYQKTYLRKYLAPRRCADTDVH